MHWGGQVGGTGEGGGVRNGKRRKRVVRCVDMKMYGNPPWQAHAQQRSHRERPPLHPKHRHAQQHRRQERGAQYGQHRDGVPLAARRRVRRADGRLELKDALPQDPRPAPHPGHTAHPPGRRQGQNAGKVRDGLREVVGVHREVDDEMEFERRQEPERAVLAQRRQHHEDRHGLKGHGDAGAEGGKGGDGEGALHYGHGAEGGGEHLPAQRRAVQPPDAAVDNLCCSNGSVGGLLETTRIKNGAGGHIQVCR